jgi:hypothetical protein
MSPATTAAAATTTTIIIIMINININNTWTAFMCVSNPLALISLSGITWEVRK